jgi:NDP-sugar pyrophosphorylase family protein
MDHLISAGVGRFVVNTHHFPEEYERAFPDGSWRGVPIIFRYEPVLLETGGGLKNIEDLLQEDEAIICYNGDIVANMPLDGLIESHEENRPEATLLLRGQGPLLNVNINERGEVCDLRHTLGRKGTRSCLFSGIYAVETSFLGFLKKGEIESVIPAFLRCIMSNPRSVRGVIIDDGVWNDIGSVEAYEAMRSLIDKQDNRGPSEAR